MIAMETMLDPARKRPAAVVRGKPAAANTRTAVIKTRPAACAAAVATAAAKECSRSGQGKAIVFKHGKVLVSSKLARYRVYIATETKERRVA